MNEFYRVEFAWGDFHYFRNKNNAFNFLWQAYLNDAPYNTEEEMEIDRKNLNEYYYIEDFGGINVLGFEDDEKETGWHEFEPGKFIWDEAEANP